MAKPDFIQEAETGWNDVDPKTTASFNVLAGDVLVAFGMIEASSASLTIAGGSLSWTQRQVVASDNQWAYVSIWTAIVDVDKSMTVTFDEVQNDGKFFGGNALTFRGSGGVGASSKTNVDGAAPTLNLTTTQANSAIVVANADWNAGDGAARTWRTNAGALTEQSYFRDAARYTVYGGYHADAGAINTYAVGLSAPGGQKYSIVAVEVKGSAGAAAPVFPRRPARGLVMR